MSSIAVEWPMTVGLVSASLILLACGLLAWAGVRKRRTRGSGTYPAPGCGTDADVGRLLDAGERTLAIRLYRELYHVDLKSAEAVVDELARTARRGS